MAKWSVKFRGERVQTRVDVDRLTRKQAEKIAAACGSGFGVVRGKSRTRAHWVVVPLTAKARAKNRRENTIVRNAHAGAL